MIIGSFAFPKNTRKKDKKLLKQKRHDCELCKRKNVWTNTHHIKSMGSGGGDTKENIIELCGTCHRLVHDGKISKEDLIKIVRKRGKRI